MTEVTYTAGEVATYLRVHPYTVKRLARSGKIPGFKVGDQWRFDARELEDWKKNQQKKPIEYYAKRSKSTHKN